MKTLTLALCSICFAISSQAQDSTATVKFEVATIKPGGNEPLQPGIAGLRTAGDRVEIRQMTLRYTIGQAYRVRPIYVFGEDWLESKFDVAGKIPEGASERQVPDMLQSLLVERFGLRQHKETRPMAVYILGLSKNGAKLKDAAPDTPNGVKNSPGAMIVIGRPDALGAAASFAGLRYPLIDQTGLTGRYEMPIDPALIFANLTTRDPVDDSDGVSRMQQAVEPLGLTITRASLPTEVVIVDHIEHTPTGN